LIPGLRRIGRLSNLHPKCDPLEFWKQKELEFPILARLAKNFFSAPSGTVATSEHEFKVAQGITSDERINILPANAERMLFLKYNTDRSPSIESNPDRSGSLPGL
jgi:hAT family C-terminal dimerisation region